MKEYLDMHTHRPDAGSNAIINLPLGAPVPEEGVYSMGIHPWDTETATEADLQLLLQAAAHPAIVAIGEAGLDSLRGAPMPWQEEVFRRQVQISEALGKPLIVHAAHTHGRIAQLRRELRPRQTWIIHGFRGKPQMAQQLLAAGCDISLGEKFNPAVAAIVPAGRLHSETDCSDMPISEIRARIEAAGGKLTFC